MELQELMNRIDEVTDWSFQLLKYSSLSNGQMKYSCREMSFKYTESLKSIIEKSKEIYTGEDELIKDDLSKKKIIFIQK